MVVGPQHRGSSALVAASTSGQRRSKEGLACTLVCSLPDENRLSDRLSPPLVELSDLLMIKAR
jgi:hypothetical protein